jgi:glycosyltransferase involved in cell wall biosynthesis
VSFRTEAYERSRLEYLDRRLHGTSFGDAHAAGGLDFRASATGIMTRRVLFLAWAPFFSGAERALLLTLRSLTHSRYEPVVLAGTDGEFAAQVKAMGVECRTVTLKQLERGRPLAGLKSIAAVIAAAMRYRVSLIHSNDAPSFQPGGYAARALRMPAVTHVRFPDTQEGFAWFLRPGFSLALFVSHALLTGALDEAPAMFAGHSEVLYDGVEMQEPSSDEEVARTRHELGLPLARTIVALTGQVAEVKGIWDFVEAARLLASRGSETLFVVLGDDLKHAGQMRRAMEARVDAFGLRDRFKFLGFLPGAPRLVSAFDIVAVPSLVEPLGNATLEAMAAGRPVVGSRVGGIPEMIVDGETGVLVPPASPLALADAIAALVHNRSLRAQMSTAARRRARDVFGVAGHGQRLQARYDRLCAPGMARANIESELA